MAEHKPMSDGERLVWAATFALWLKHNLASERTPPHLYNPSRKADLEAWTEAQKASAVESAWAAVKSMRDAIPHVREGWGEPGTICGDVTEMLLEMTEGHD